MKNLFLAAAAVLTLGAGTAFAADTTTAQPVQAQRTTQAANSPAQSGGEYGSGIYVSNSPRRQVWVYGAMQGPGDSQGGQQ